MELLKLYIISTLISFIIVTISAKSMAIKLKREGLKGKNKPSIWEKTHSTLPLFIPIFNIFLAILMIFNFKEVMDKTRESINAN